VSEHVKKGLVMCYVHTPKLDPDTLASPERCLPLLKIQEISTTRWIPAQTRELETPTVVGVVQME
jgi:hypothetical protein